MPYLQQGTGDGGITAQANYPPFKSQWSPYLFNTTLTTYGMAPGATTLEVAPTQHGAVMRFRFPPLTAGPVDGIFNQTRRLYITLPDAADALAVTGTDGQSPVTFTGYSSIGVPNNGAMHFYATLSGDCAGGSSNSTLPPASAWGVQNVSGQQWAWVEFAERADHATDCFAFQVATSLISPAQAQAAHAAEVAGMTLDAVTAAAKAVWHAQASRIVVSDVGAGYEPRDADDLLTIFYSSLYRASKFPRMLYEIDYANGNAPFHWSAPAGKVLPGVLSSDLGFWDAYRTTFSLLSLTRPDYLASAMEGFLNIWREAGGAPMPQWPKCGLGGGMTGTYSDVAFSEAIVKLPHCGTKRGASAGYCVNASALYAACHQNAFNRDPNYNSSGFIVGDVSTTEGNYLCDWSIAQAATLLGYTSDAETLLKSSARFATLLEPTSGFMVPRNASGDFIQNFDQYGVSGGRCAPRASLLASSRSHVPMQWGPGLGYTEAGPWQYRLEVPHDPQGLKAALAAIGVDACGVVQAANTQPSIFHKGSYGTVIHEAAEMAANCWGQWELNNQPVWALQHMQVAFDTSVTGKCAQQAQYWLRKSASLFRPGPTMFPGDEDSACGGEGRGVATRRLSGGHPCLVSYCESLLSADGSMGAWYILNALGLYPLSPASGDYVLGSPQFGAVAIPVSASAWLNITTVNQGPANVYVQAVMWNGVPVAGVTVPYGSLMEGGVLEFTLGATPASPLADRMPVA